MCPTPSDKINLDENMLHVDEDSLKEVATYIHEHKQNARLMKRHGIQYTSKDDKIEHLSSMLKVLQDIQYQNEMKNSQVNNGNNTSPPPEPPFQLFRGRLLMKIFSAYILFARNSSMTRCVIFFIISIFYYLFEIGLIGKWLKAYVQRRNEVRNGRNSMPPVPNNQAVLDNNPNHNEVIPPPVQNPQQQQQQPPPPRDFIEYIHQLSQSGIKIPVAAGVLNDIFSLLASFISSLFPTWHPEAAPQN